MKKPGKRKGFFGSQVGFLFFGVMFIVFISLGATALDIDGVNCGNAAESLSPPENSTNLESALTSADGLVTIFFGCSSTNNALNGFFTALKAGVVLIFLYIIKDLVPFT